MLQLLVVSGVANGSIYAIVALGMTLIYRSTRVLNFAHGEIFTIGAYLAYTFYQVLRLPYAVAIVATVGCGLLLGLLLERVCRRPLAAGSMISVVLATIGVGFTLKGLARLLWRSDYLTFPPIYGMEPRQVAGILLSPQDAIIITASLTLMAVFFFVFRFTSLGKRLRASASNRLGAVLVGIRPRRVSSAAWGISCMLGVTAGILVAPISLVYPDMGFDVFVKAFAGAVLGGFGSFPGAVVGGLVVGIVENLAGGYVSTLLVGASPFVIITAVLLFFPHGLFGGLRER